MPKLSHTDEALQTNRACGEQNRGRYRRKCIFNMEVRQLPGSLTTVTWALMQLRCHRRVLQREYLEVLYLLFGLLVLGMLCYACFGFGLRMLCSLRPAPHWQLPREWFGSRRALSA